MRPWQLLMMLTAALFLLQKPQSTSALLVPPCYYIFQRDHGQVQAVRRLLDLRSTSSSENNESTWTLSEDWALMDNVPRYTVGDTSTNHARTFWLQLGTSIPVLNRFSEEELQGRYSNLVAAAENNQTTTSITTTAVCSSPPLLQDWHIVVPTTTTTTTTTRTTTSPKISQMQGCLEDGRTIWFEIQTIGRLGDDPIGKHNNVEKMMMEEPYFAGGFVEATGGRVYELGRPLAITVGAASAHGERAAEFVSLLDQSKKVTPIAVTLMSAALSVAIVSAAVGHGAGLALRHDQTTTTSSIDQLSIQQSRAGLEARVLQEQRAVWQLQNRLQDDWIALDRLRQDEQNAGDQAAMIPAILDSSERIGLSPTEKRARMEARVLREQQVLDTTAKQLSVDAARLNDLKQRENLLP